MHHVPFQGAFLPPNHSNNIYPEEAVCFPQSDPKPCLHKSTEVSETVLSTKKMVPLVITERKLPASRRECEGDRDVITMERVLWADLPNFLLPVSLLALSTILLILLSFCIFIGSFPVNIYIVQCISLKGGKMFFSEMWQFFKVFCSKCRIWGNLRHARGLQGFCKGVGGQKCGG